MSTVTSGTVEYYAQHIRDAGWLVKTDEDVFVYVTGMISALVGSPSITDAEKVERVRNTLAAGNLVRAEMRAVR